MKISINLIKKELKELKRELLYISRGFKSTYIKSKLKIAYHILRKDIKYLENNIIDLNTLLYELKDIKEYLINYIQLTNKLYDLFINLNNHIIFLIDIKGD